jgi:S-adenosylmethionine:tRNA ribosyltransferase-isomerase
VEGSTATITHAAAISSAGDVELDALLPLDERYCIQTATAVAVCPARVRGGRVVAIGSSVVGADDAAPADGSVRRGTRLTTQRIGRVSRVRMVDAVLSRTQQPGTSHYELLRAFLDEDAICRMDAALSAAK